MPAELNPPKKNNAAQATPQTQGIDAKKWSLQMDGLWLSDTVQGTSPWTIAVGATSGQATKVKVQPGAAYRLLPPKDAAQNTAARKIKKSVTDKSRMI